MVKNDFCERLKIKMDDYVHLIYRLTKEFPKEEFYNVTSQLKRSTLSIILNYIEGFARQKKAIKQNFLGNFLRFIKRIQISSEFFSGRRVY